jgi:hypothetical protein
MLRWGALTFQIIKVLSKEVHFLFLLDFFLRLRETGIQLECLFKLLHIDTIND